MSRTLVLLPLLLAIVPAVAAPRDKADGSAFRPSAVSPSVKSEMARYSLSAFENRDATNAIKALLYTPKPVGRALLPMVVYLPGKGELGELEDKSGLARLERLESVCIGE